MAEMTKFNKQAPPASDNYIRHSLARIGLSRLAELYLFGGR